MRNIDILSFSDSWRGAYSCGVLFRYTKHKQLRPNALKVLNCRKREAKSRLTVGSSRWSGCANQTPISHKHPGPAAQTEPDCRQYHIHLSFTLKLRKKESALRKPAPDCTVSSVP